jgi:FtsH-binding integral membrane protein
MSRYPQYPQNPNDPYGRQPYTQAYSAGPGPFGLGYQDARSAALEGVIASFFNAVYAWMAVGLAVTGIVAWLVSQNTSMMMALHGSGMTIVLLLGLVVLSFVIGASAHRIGPGPATGLFLVYSAGMGALLSYIFVVYKLGTIVTAFGATAGTFAVMSVIGFTTKRDLSRMGSILIMIVIGLFIASLVNFFARSSALSWAVTYIAVVAFTLLTAYDTQRLKHVAVETAGNARAAASYAIVGALSLYLNFINIFISLLRILGDRR